MNYRPSTVGLWIINQIGGIMKGLEEVIVKLDLEP